MIDRFKKFIYQIEINTIATTMGLFSDGVKKFFSHFSKKYPEYFSKYIDNETYQVPLHKENVIDGIGDSMVEAIRMLFPDTFRNTLIVFIVQHDERNEFDQRAIENYLWENQ
jgi:hypothetical protein